MCVCSENSPIHCSRRNPKSPRKAQDIRKIQFWYNLSSKVMILQSYEKVLLHQGLKGTLYNYKTGSIWMRNSFKPCFRTLINRKFQKKAITFNSSRKLNFLKKDHQHVFSHRDLNRNFETCTRQNDRKTMSFDLCVRILMVRNDFLKLIHPKFQTLSSP